MRPAFTDLVGVPQPIVGFNRSPGVVAAVASPGGFGVLAASACTNTVADCEQRIRELAGLIEGVTP